ncbi:MAG TPA: hypothetical protein VMZ71_02295 [Gemmataceae bacterium]|nr:hypothetical protein [Gemmataceae bacterium]
MSKDKEPFRLPDDFPDPALARGRRVGRTEKVVELPPLEPIELRPPDPEGVPLFAPTGPAPSDLLEYRRILLEQARRKSEALKLYEPLPTQAEFHACKARQRLLRGSNRSGKTLSTAVEIARAVTSQDPHEKYPALDGRVYAVGRDEKHIGEVMYRKLFRPGAFRMIRDAATREWRAYRPWNEADLWRKKESKPAPALIPRRFVKHEAWKSKAGSVPEKIVLTTGWEIDFFTSLGKPPRGSDLDLVWFDEEIVDGDWHPEMMARLLDRSGSLIWGATPQTGTDRLLELHLRCEREYMAWVERGKDPKEEPEAREFVVLLSENPHIGESEKKELAASLDEADHAVRIGGEFAIQAAKIYPEFSAVHCLPYFDIPPDWTRFAVVDPGRQICAVLFAAVPPPDGELPKPVGRAGEHTYVVLYDELYIPNCSAALFGERMGERCRGQQFEAFLIDSHGSRNTEMGSGKTVESQYSEALAENGVECVRTGTGFTWASDDVVGGLEAVRGMLRIRARPGFPTLFVSDLVNKLPNFKYEIDRYRYKREAGRPTDKPEDKGRVHLMACFDQDTEVLTRDGWFRFRDLRRDAQIATVNLDSDEIEYQAATDYIARPHNGDMIRIEGRRLDVMVTPDHRMVVYPRKSSNPVVKLASDLHRGDRIKMSGRWIGNGRHTYDLPETRQSSGHAISAGDFAELLGWYTAEGCRDQKVTMPGRGFYALISQYKAEGVRRISALTQRLPWNFRRTEQGFVVSSQQLWVLLGECGDYAENKRVPQWVKDSPPDVIERFIDGAVGGDGWSQHGTRYYKTISRRLADDMQELFLKIGRSASIGTRPAGEWCIEGRSGKSQASYVVIENLTPTAGLRNADHEPNFSRLHYDGMVYCVTVPNGTLIVRRNDKVIVAGNCARYLAMYAPKYVEPRTGPAKPSGAYAAFLQSLKAKKKGAGGATSFGPRR